MNPLSFAEKGRRLDVPTRNRYPVPMSDTLPFATRLLWPLIRGYMRLCFQLLAGGIHAEGQENIPKTGGVLFCPNHVCEADPCAVAVALSRRVHFMAKAKLFKNPLAGALLRHCLAFPVESGTADIRALRHVETLLKNGHSVVIFPEGGGNHENTLRPLHGGAALTALKTNVCIVPVAIFNTDALWPYGGSLRRSGVPVRVVFGEPLDFADRRGSRNAVKNVTQVLTRRLAEMLNQPVPPEPASSD